MGELGEGQGRERRLRRRADDDGAARRERRRALAGDHGGGEIPRGDRGDDADRLLQHHDSLAGQRVVDHVAVDALAFLREPLDKRRRVGDLPARLGQRLALLARHQHREVFLIGHHQLEPPAHQVGAFLRRARTPSRPRRIRGLDGGAGFLRPQGGDGADGLAGRGVVDLNRAAAVRVDPFAVHVALLAEESGVGQGDRCLGIHGRVSGK